MDETGFPRATIQQALSVDRFALSKLISVVSKVPGEIVAWIGHAPSAGEKRWKLLAESLDKQKIAKVSAYQQSSDVQKLSNDERFEAVLKLVTATETSRKPSDHWVAKTGAKVAKYTQDDKKFSLVIDEKVAPSFGQFLLGKMDDLFEEFNRQNSK